MILFSLYKEQFLKTNTYMSWKFDYISKELSFRFYKYCEQDSQTWRKVGVGDKQDADIGMRINFFLSHLQHNSRFREMC